MRGHGQFASSFSRISGKIESISFHRPGPAPGSRPVPPRSHARRASQVSPPAPAIAPCCRALSPFHGAALPRTPNILCAGAGKRTRPDRLEAAGTNGHRGIAGLSTGSVVFHTNTLHFVVDTRSSHKLWRAALDVQHRFTLGSGHRDIVTGVGRRGALSDHLRHTRGHVRSGRSSRPFLKLQKSGLSIPAPGRHDIS